MKECSKEFSQYFLELNDIFINNERQRLKSLAFHFSFQTLKLLCCFNIVMLKVIEIHEKVYIITSTKTKGKKNENT